MPSINAVVNADGSIGGLAYNGWANEPVVQEPVSVGGDFDLKAPDEEGPEEAVDEPETSAKRPNVSDLKEAWVDYAVSQGEGRRDAELMLKGELIEKYGDLFDGW